MCCTVTQSKFWFGRWVLTAGFDLTMSSCPASLRRFSSGTKFTEWDSTSGSTGDQLYHALPPPNSFLPHLPFSSTTYYIPTWSVWLSYLLLQNTAIFILPPFNFHSLCSTILYFRIDDFTFSSFELWKKEIIWHASLPHAPPPPQNWQESVPKRIISTASTADGSRRPLHCRRHFSNILVFGGMRPQSGMQKDTWVPFWWKMTSWYKDIACGSQIIWGGPI